LTWYFLCINQNNVVGYVTELKHRWAFFFNICGVSGSSHDPRAICHGVFCDFV